MFQEDDNTKQTDETYKDNEKINGSPAMAPVSDLQNETSNDPEESCI